MKKILKGAALSFTGILLSVGAVSAQTGSIDTTGPDSENTVTHTSSVDTEVNNDTTLDATLDVSQEATSGEARANHNTEAGDAETGDAENDNSIDAMVEVDNSGAADIVESAGNGGSDGSGSLDIDRTGPDSTNTITSESTVNTEVNNTTDVTFDVSVDQTAETGDATVNDNTMGGSATTGSASNTSSTTFSFSVMN